MNVNESKMHLLGGLLLAALVISGCSKSQPSAAASAPPPSVPVVVTTVQKKDVPVGVRSIGNVEAINMVGIKSLISGEIMAVHFREGQDVNRGDLLFEIDSRQVKADLARAESTLQKDLAAAKNSRVQAERYAKLLQEGVVAKQQYDEIVATADAQQAGVEADRAAVENAKLQVNYTNIYAPITGRTGNLAVDRGNIVKENENPPLVTINQISPIYVQFAVPEQQLAEVKRYLASKTLKVEAFLQGSGSAQSVSSNNDAKGPAGSDAGKLQRQINPGEGIRGELSFIDNSVDSATGTIKLKGTFPNTDRLLWPGQFVDVVLTLTTESNATVVPSQAVQTGQQGAYVFVVKDDLSAEMRPVDVKRTVSGEAVIERGLNPGERVVIDGQLRLTNGAKVEIKSAAGEKSSSLQANGESQL